MNGIASMPLSPPQIIRLFPFAVLELSGKDAIDFLQRISTNNIAARGEGAVQKTLLVSDKGRIIDTVWVVNHSGQLLLLVSEEYAAEVTAFLEKYIIMDDVTVRDVSSVYACDLHFSDHGSGFRSDFFGHAVWIDLRTITAQNRHRDVFADADYERWRIENGIPKAKKEIAQDFNPLELNLWEWISFTKGCYIGQEVIARLDTYKKVQRSLCYCTSGQSFSEGDVITDEEGTEIGRITSSLETDNGQIGLCLIRSQYAHTQRRVNVKQKDIVITIERVFSKGN